LAEVEVAGCGGLVALFAEDAHADVRLLDHVDVVAAVSDTKNSFLKAVFKEFNDSSLLRGCTPTEN
jgi:hypothetical protein